MSLIINFIVQLMDHPIKDMPIMLQLIHVFISELNLVIYIISSPLENSLVMYNTSFSFIDIRNNVMYYTNIVERNSF